MGVEQSPLELATRRADVFVVETLLEAGAHISLDVLKSVRDRELWELILSFTDKATLPAEAIPVLEHIFFSACQSGWIEVVDLLLEKALVDVNLVCTEPNVRGWTIGDSALHVAVKFADLPLCEVLLRHGANKLKPNGVGKSPIDVATSFRGYTAICKLLLDSA